MRFVADFHIHSKYSRATSSSLDADELAKWAKIKGIGLIGTGDFTHPQWLAALKEKLRPTGDGFFAYNGARFILTTEVNTLFYRQGRAKNVHHVLLAPSFESVDRINKELARFGDLGADGRPLLTIEAKQLVKIVLGADPRCVIVPAHAWTPHFAIFGSNSGFDSVEECFQEETPKIFALETGLSSDPAMNWRLSRLDRYALLSNSDSHSARRIGREANVFDCPLEYDALIAAIKSKDPARFLFTVEFFPAEGKYHFDGHRKCQARLSPADSRAAHLRCPACGRPVTVGVMHRVETLADRPEGYTPPRTVPFKNLIPLDEIIAAALGVGTGTQTVDREYMMLIEKIGTEFDILLHTPEEALRKHAQPKVAEGILRVRRGEVHIEPGYDGEYGTVRLFGETDAAPSPEQQMTLF